MVKMKHGLKVFRDFSALQITVTSANSVLQLVLPKLCSMHGGHLLRLIFWHGGLGLGAGGQNLLQLLDLLRAEGLRELYRESDVQVALLVGPAVHRHALLIDTLPAVWLDDLSGKGHDLKDPPVQMLYKEWCATEGFS